jgi:aconitate hydratase
MLWRENESTIQYSSIVVLDLNTVEPTVAGPKRPQDKILLKELDKKFEKSLSETFKRNYVPIEKRFDHKSQADPNNLHTAIVEINNEKFALHDGSVVIAAITSCTNTSNPSVMIGAGLLARKALQRGLQIKPWVKTSLAPGSKVVTDYLTNSGLLKDLEGLKFFNTGYGCSSCIGNSGPLPTHIAKAINDSELVVASVLSGNRNFEARVHQQVKMNFLMSPMLVVAFALAGRVDINLTTEPLAYDSNQLPVYLKDIWPSNEEISGVMSKVLSVKDFENNYSTIFSGNLQWQDLKAPEGQLFQWDKNSTYIKEAPFFIGISTNPSKLNDIEGANVLLKLGDSITTDHISPAGSFNENSPAGRYLLARNVEKSQFNSYGSRRGNDEIMARGTFANVRIKNQLIEKEGGYTKYIPSGEEMSVFEASEKYQKAGIPLIVIAGKEYGSGSSRDWAAKGPNLLGIKAVIAESYERIHRSNLVGMGILPLQFIQGQNAESIGLSGTESFQISGIAENLKPSKSINVKAKRLDGSVIEFEALCRLDSAIEVEYYRNGGILHYVLRQFLNS